jgi:dihydroorotate dehydrogenase (NAD+) catalytic subunit
VVDLTTRLGPVTLRSPLIGACGTVGSVVDFAAVGALEAYGAAVAKSVSGDPWPGRPTPRMAPTAVGMLNGIGIQNPGVDAWAAEIGPQLPGIDIPVWGSAVGASVDEFALVAKKLELAGVAAIEVNLSCPNLEAGTMFALDPVAAPAVVSAVRNSVTVPIGAKLSPNSEDIVSIARSVAESGADWVVLTNTVWGFGIDVETRRPLLSGGVGGYSGRALKPIAMRCVWEVRRAFPDLPIVGLGGVTCGADVIEYLLAGANAVGIGTAHFAAPRVGRSVMQEVDDYCAAHGVAALSDLVDAAEPWS